MTWVHRISDLDEQSRTATCAECGPVDVRPNKGRFMCGNKRREDARKYRKPKEHYRSKYGISPDEALELLASQGGVCKICQGQEEPFCVDHCHETGKVRGILCRRCNSGLGMFKDSPDIIRKAAEYLDNS